MNDEELLVWVKKNTGRKYFRQLGPNGRKELYTIMGSARIDGHGLLIMDVLVNRNGMKIIRSAGLLHDKIERGSITGPFIYGWIVDWLDELEDFLEE